MITKERIALFFGGIMVIGSIEVSLYGGNFYIAAILLVLGALCLLFGVAINQQRYDVIPVLEKELQHINGKMDDFKFIVEKTPKQEDTTAIIEKISALVELSTEYGKSFEKLMPFAEGEINKIHQEIVALKAIMEDTPRRNDLKMLTEEFSAFSNLSSDIDNSLKHFLTETKKLNDMAHDGQEKILIDTGKNNEELIKACQNIIEDTVSKIRQELSMVIEDTDILKNNYLKANNELIEKQAAVAADTGKNIVSIGQEMENKINGIIELVGKFSDDTAYQLEDMGKTLNDNLNVLCDNIKNSIEELNEEIKGEHKKLVNNLSKDIESMSENVSALAQSYEDFKAHNNALINEFTKMSEDDAKIINSILST